MPLKQSDFKLRPAVNNVWGSDGKKLRWIELTAAAIMIMSEKYLTDDTGKFILDADGKFIKVNIET